MHRDIEYTAGERFWLSALAVFGFVVVNGLFLYALFLRPETLTEAMTNPVALAFLLEATVLLVAFAYLLGRWGVSRRSWLWFVGLSILGSMAFALPVVLLWRGGTAERTSS